MRTSIIILIFGLLAFLASIGSYAKDIDSDFLPEIPAENEKYLDSADNEKARALTSYAIAYLAMMDGRGFSKEAAESLVKTLEHDPKAKLPLQRLLNGLSKEGNTKNYYQRCFDLLFPIVKKKPEALKLSLIVAFALRKLGRDSEALALMEKSYQLVSSSEELRKNELFDNLIISIAEILRKTGDWQRGQDLFEDAFSDTELKKNIKLRNSAARFFYEASEKASETPYLLFFDSDKKRYKNAFQNHLDALKELNSREKINKRSLASMLVLFSQLKMYDEAKRFLLDKLLSEPENIDCLSSLAAVYYDLGEYQNAFRVWCKILRGLNMEASFYYDMGRAALLGKKYEEAATAFEWHLMNYKPKDRISMYWLALAYFELGKYKSAISTLEKCRNFPEASLLNADCHRRLGLNKEALKILQSTEAIAKRQNRKKFLSTDFYLSMAYVADKADEYSTAVEILIKLREKEPENVELANFLGYLWAEHSENLPEARKLIEFALQKDPDNSAYLDSMAWVLYKQKNFKQAVKYINLALKHEGDVPDAVIADHAGDIYAASGKTELALEYWKTALEIFSDDINPQIIKSKIQNLQPKSN